MHCQGASTRCSKIVNGAKTSNSESTSLSNTVMLSVDVSCKIKKKALSKMSWPFTVNLSNAKIHWFHMFLIMDLEDGTSLQPK